MKDKKWIFIYYISFPPPEMVFRTIESRTIIFIACVWEDIFFTYSLSDGQLVSVSSICVFGVDGGAGMIYIWLWVYFDSIEGDKFIALMGFNVRKFDIGAGWGGRCSMAVSVASNSLLGGVANPFYFHSNSNHSPKPLMMLLAAWSCVYIITSLPATPTQSHSDNRFLQWMLSVHW